MPDPISWSFALPWLLAALGGGYILGSVPIGWLLTRAAGLGDIRQTGSGNIGATNVLRTGRVSLGVLTLLGDAGKGALAAWMGSLYGPDMAVVAAAGALIGHIFPIWLGFRGGKGAASYAGIIPVLALPVLPVCALVWLLTLALTRRSSAASLAALCLAPFAAAWFGEWQVAELFAFLSALIIFTHRANIGRLLRGEEPPIGRR